MHDEQDVYTQVVAAYDHVFGTPLGKLVLADLEKGNFIHHPTHVPGDPHGTSVNEGRRVAILGIHAMIRIAHSADFLQGNLNDHFSVHTTDDSEGGEYGR